MDAEVSHTTKAAEGAFISPQLCYAEHSGFTISLSHGRMRKLFVAVSTVLMLASCGSTDIPPVLIQAEQFNRGNAIIDNGERGYGQNIGVILNAAAPPTFVEYDFDVPKTSNYRLDFRYASAVPRPVRVLVDKELITDHATDKATGGFLPENQQWLEQCVVLLTRGRHTLRLESEMLPHIDQLKFSATSESPTKQ